MNSEETQIYCIHCEGVYSESDEKTVVIHATRYSPADYLQLCPYCETLADDNTEATPEQIEYYLNN